MAFVVFCFTEKLPGRNEQASSMTLSFHFGLLEVTEVDDMGQSLTVPMYLNVAWPERRMWINESYRGWSNNITAPLNVRVYGFSYCNLSLLLRNLFWMLLPLI